MTTKQILSVLGVLVVLAIIFGVWSSYTKPISTATPTAGDTSMILGGRLETDQNYHYTEAGPGYEIRAVYPAEVPLPTAEAGAKAALAIENKLAEGIAIFKADIAQMLTPQEMARLQEFGASYALGFEYVDYTAEGYHSYAYQVYQDTGGAHPNGFYLTFVFDLEGNQVKLADLLANNPNWLEELSLLVSNDVSAQYRARAGVDDLTGLIYPEGLAPREDNFANFVIDGDELVILIPPYQVAAYALGSFEVHIPLSDINR